MTVGVVGLGNMGGRIARRIVDGGERVVGYDADSARPAAAGAEAAGSLAELAAATDVVLLSLPDSTVIEAVMADLEGELREGQVVVDLSTAAPSSTRAIHDRLAPRVAYLDAGISGGAAAAEAGTLTVMVGGSEEALDTVRPVLAHFAKHVHHMGASGSGHVTKLLNNFLNGISLAATAEVMVAGRKAGLDLRKLLEVVNASSGVNFATLNRFPRIVEGDYLEGGLTSDLMAKDLMLYLDLVRELEVTSLNGPPCLAAFHLAAALGYGDQISNRVVDALGDIAGGVRIQEGT
ncbi:MAG TPA: NAD(P)-dependent oxidoreductase [Solirubrobacteraceae bacterium]|nr:NAD(P)-dependent oxidoreductase [Solirubrobacteraceae bacterium]